MLWQLQYRLSLLKNHFHQHFANFGNEFFIKGIPLRRNSFDGTINVSTDIASRCKLYAEVTGQVWNRAVTYDLLIGLNARF